MPSELEANLHANTKAFVEDVWSGKWILDKTLAHRAPECVHTLLPKSQGVPKRNNEEWAGYFKNVEGLVWGAKVSSSLFLVFSICANSLVDDNARIHRRSSTEADCVLVVT